MVLGVVGSNPISLPPSVSNLDTLFLFYTMGILSGKKGLITGVLNEQSLAWHVAKWAKAEGATVVLTNTPAAIRMGTVAKLADQQEMLLLPADATNVEDLRVLYQATLAHLGGPVDFMLHAIGMSPNLRKKRGYGALHYEDYQKTLDISAISFHKMLQVAEEESFLAEYASVVALSYIAAQRTFPFYGDMADAKALLESIARGYGYRLGKSLKVRVNTVSQSPTQTTAGAGIGDVNDMMGYADRLSPLGNAPAEDCARFVVTLFSDYTRYITMQNIYHDGGYSSMGMTNDLTL